MRALFAARLVDFKDPITFILASQLLPQHNFTVAGDGELLNECKKLAGPNVTFLGWVPQKIVNERMLESDLFCQLSPVENVWSSSMILAMKCQKAIICTDVGYTAKFLKDGIHALLIPARNEKSLANAIVKLEEDSLRHTLAANAHQYFVEYLQMPKITKRIHDLIHSTFAQQI
jgi:glycosyltransferase involved in cell wall biosynthesis